MEVGRIIAEIDAQIEKLQQARSLLADATVKTGRRPGRPKGSGNLKATVGTPRRHRLSAEGRKRISEAMKRRHAERRKLAAKAAAAAK